MHVVSVYFMYIHIYTHPMIYMYTSMIYIYTSNHMDVVHTMDIYLFMHVVSVDHRTAPDEEGGRHL